MSKSSSLVCRHCGKPIEENLLTTGYLHIPRDWEISFSFCDIGSMRNHNRAEPKTKNDYIKDFIQCLK